MSKGGVSNAFIVGTILGLVAITALGVFLIHRSDSFAASVTPSVKSSTEFFLSPPPSGPATPVRQQRGAYSTGPGSHYGTLSLASAYVCRETTIEIIATAIDQLLNDKGTGVSMLDLARGAKLLGPFSGTIKRGF